MPKMVVASCIAVASIALVLPAAASAANKPQLTDAQGAVKAGATIWLTNIGEVVFYSTGGKIALSCTTAHLTGTVTRNDSGSVEVLVTKANFSGTGPVNGHNSLPECFGPSGGFYVTLGLPLCLKSTPVMATHEFQMITATGEACNIGGQFKFTLGGTGFIGPCLYEGTQPIKASFVTDKVPAELTVNSTQAGSGAKFVEGSAFCFSSVMLSAKFSMETDTASGSIFDPISITKLP